MELLIILNHTSINRVEYSKERKTQEKSSVAQLNSYVFTKKCNKKMLRGMCEMWEAW